MPLGKTQQDGKGYVQERAQRLNGGHAPQGLS
jgi:hypothetical protein